jgi:TonB family protein
MRRLTFILLLLALFPAVMRADDASGRKVVARAEVVYPPLAQKMGIHGTVKAKLWIAPDGSVRRVEYISGHPLLADSAVSALKKWKYTPDSAGSTEIVEVKF